jgi:integrase
MNNRLHTALKLARISTTGDGSVFCTLQGTPCCNFRTAFERAVRKAGIADFTFHDLRHTFASRLVMAG